MPNNHTYLKGFFIISLATGILGACASSTLSAEQSFRRGRFVEAKQIWQQEVSNVSQESNIAFSNQLHHAINFSAFSLLEQAKAAEKNDNLRNPYILEALVYARTALQMMVDNHPLFVETNAIIRRLEKQKKESERAYTKNLDFYYNARRQNNTVAGISALYDLVEIISQIGGAEPTVEQVLAWAEDTLANQQYENAITLLNLANHLRLLQCPNDPHLMTDVAGKLAALRFFIEAKPKEPDPNLSKKLTQLSLIQPGNISMPWDEANTSEPVEQKAPPKAKIRTTRRHIRRYTQLKNNKQIVNAQFRLAQAQKKAAQNLWLDAFKELDEVIALYGTDTSFAFLAEQQTNWQNKRTALIQKLVSQGEHALSQEDTKNAYRYYEQILQLDGSHTLAQDRLRKLKKLYELQKQTN